MMLLSQEVRSSDIRRMIQDGQTCPFFVAPMEITSSKKTSWALFLSPVVWSEALREFWFSLNAESHDDFRYEFRNRAS